MDKMAMARGFCLVVALWDTAVFIINVGVLPLFYSPDLFLYMTLDSQLRPVMILLVIWFYCAIKDLPPVGQTGAAVRR